MTPDWVKGMSNALEAGGGSVPKRYSWEGSRVNWDLDGVLAPLMETTLEVYNKRFNDNLTVDDSTTYWIAEMPLKCSPEEIHTIMAEIPYGSLSPYPGMIEIVRAIADLGFATAVVSSLMWFHPNNTHAVEKRDWVHKYLGEDIATIFTGDKHWCCRHPGDILIDDKVKNVAQWPGRGVLLEQPWNRNDRVSWMDSCPPSQLQQHLLDLLHVNLFEGGPTQ